jgi:hypothetical protein
MNKSHQYKAGRETTWLGIQHEQLNLGKWFVDIFYNPKLKS